MRFLLAHGCTWPKNGPLIKHAVTKLKYPPKVKHLKPRATVHVIWSSVLEIKAFALMGLPQMVFTAAIPPFSEGLRKLVKPLSWMCEVIRVFF